MKIVILYSGGLDSFIMHHKAKIDHPDAEIISVYFDHGANYCKREISGLPSFVQIRRLDWLDNNHTTIVQPGRREGAIMIPGRNLVFATTLACQELPDELWIGALHGETHEKGTDKNYTFLAKLNETLNYVIGPFRNKVPMYCKFPLADAKLDKLDSVKWALTHGLTPEELMATRSCHDGSTNKCGGCIQCIKRWAVFGECGFSENYDNHPMKSDFGKSFVKDLINCELGLDDYYGEETRAEVIPYIFKYATLYPGYFELETLAKIKQIISSERNY